jgi:hypothetical protein
VSKSALRVAIDTAILDAFVDSFWTPEAAAELRRRAAGGRVELSPAGAPPSAESAEAG